MPSSHVITDERRLREVIDYFRAQPAFAFDLEAQGEHRGVTHLCDVTWLSMATTGLTVVIPFGHPIGTRVIRYDKEPRLCQDGKTRNYRVPVYEPAPRQLDRDLVFEIVRPLFFDQGIVKSAHGAVYDIAASAKYFGEVMPGPYNDTIIQAWLCDENRLRYGLKYLVRDIYGYRYDDEEVGKCVERHPFGKVAHYSYCDALFAWLLYKRYAPQIEALGLRRVYDLEMDVLNVLVGMRLAGSHVDTQRLRELKRELAERREKVRAAVIADAGRDFNLNSTRDKQAVLFGPREAGGQALVPWKPTDTGKKQLKAGDECTAWSTDDEVLASYPTNPVAAGLREYQETNKLLSTYVLAYLGNPARDKAPQVYDDRIHADFVQYGTNTRRFSCRNPNLQNIPRPDTELGKLIRGVWDAEPGWKLVVADYGQIELVLFAHFCGQGALYDGFWAGADPHQITADKLGISRQMGKRLNFCVPMDTEALTRSGWKLYQDLSVGEEVLSYDGENLRWSPILDLYQFEDADLIDLQSGPWHVRCTPGHRWVTDRRTGSTQIRRLVREMTTTENLTSEHSVIVAAPLAAENMSGVTASEAAIIAWLFTDGHMQRSPLTGRTAQGKDGRRRKFEASIFQKKECYVHVLDELLAGVPHHRYVRPTGIVQWLLQPEWMRDLWRRARLDEHSLSEFVLSLGTTELEAFAEAAWQAEGWMNGSSRMLAQNSGPVCDALALAVFLTGHRPSFSSNGVYKGRENFNIHYAKNRVGMQKAASKPAGSEPVWCMRTADESWVMRQGQQIMITGNSMSYGAGLYLVASMLGVEIAEARVILDDHRREFPEIYEFKERVVSLCRQAPHEVRTLLGGIRRLPEIMAWAPRRAPQEVRDKADSTRRRAERQAVSAVIQGSAADLIKLAMVRADRNLADDAPDAFLTLCVHDELVAEVPDSQVEAAKAAIERAMLGTEMQRLIDVPLTADVKVVERWSLAK